MKLLVVLIVSLCSVGSLYAQENDVIPSQENSDSLSEELFTVVDQMPMYPGGDNQLIQFMIDNIKYPRKAYKAKISGTVFVTFTITKTGKVTDAVVQKGIGYDCDETALNAVNKMPDWIPGYQNKKPVSVKYTLPVRFYMRETHKSDSKK